MDPKRLKDVHDRLESLDDRLSYRLRARAAGPGRASLEQIEDRLRDVTEYALELRTLVFDLLLGLVSKPDSEPPAR
ncbi:MAG: hypothetical protein ABI639_12880 [Thermoanaerobaculia bacterium]